MMSTYVLQFQHSENSPQFVLALAREERFRGGKIIEIFILAGGNAGLSWPTHGSNDIIDKLMLLFKFWSEFRVYVILTSSCCQYKTTASLKAAR